MSGTECHADREEDYMFLHSMLMEKKLHLLFKIHERLRRFEKRGAIPAHNHAVALVTSLLEEVTHDTRAAVKELFSLLCKPHFKSLLRVHDTVAWQDFEPTLPPLPADVPEEDGDSVKIVSLVKTNQPLGATIKRDGSTGAIVVARIMKGGAADKSGLIHEGDELKEVNGVSLERKKPKEILPLLACSPGDITFKVIPAYTEDQLSTARKTLFVRALFSYEPSEDPTVPCKEAALAFKKGDILQIVGKEDDTWWQARRHGDGDTWAGLIPSQQLHERRVALQRPKALFKTPRHVQPADDDDDEVKEATDYGALTGIHIAGVRRSFRLCRRGGRVSDAQDRGRSTRSEAPARAPTYREVVPYRRDATDRQRLVLLVGSAGVGVSELQRRLLVSDPEHFGVTVPHTSRERRGKEKDGVDYCFVSQRRFEEDILNHRFIEYGMYRGHYYGISLDSIEAVVSEGRVCLLSVHPNTIKSLHTSEFKPYVVFVKPPRIEELRFTRRRATFIGSEDKGTPARGFCEEDFQDMIGSAEAMEAEYGHLFDKVLVNGDIATALRELRAALESAAGPEVQWIPAEWFQNIAQQTTEIM